jgi:hypothetical protein
MRSVVSLLAAGFTLAWGLVALWLVHTITAGDLSKGCPGGGCEGFPVSAWAETWTVVLGWLVVNAITLSLPVRVQSDPPPAERRVTGEICPKSAAFRVVIHPRSSAAPPAP